MSFDPSGRDQPARAPSDPISHREHRAAPTQPYAPGGEAHHQSGAPAAGIVTPHGRPGVYIYPFWQRTEFLVMLLISLAVAIAAAIEDGFPAQAAWTLITILGAAYILSRGFAKREPRDDASDKPWTPGSR